MYELHGVARQVTTESTEVQVVWVLLKLQLESVAGAVCSLDKGPSSCAIVYYLGWVTASWKLKLYCVCTRS